MATLADRIRAVADMSAEQAEHLRTLCTAWQVLADLSFADLFLYVPVRHMKDTFEIAAQVRPFTSQTLYPRDMVGIRVTQPEHPVVERAYREGTRWTQEAPVLVDGIPVRLDAVPVRWGDHVLGVVTKEGSPATSRRPGRLEQVYLDMGEQVSQMITDGLFPFDGVPVGEWPRVGDGSFLIDEEGKVVWASPNALSSLRRLGVRQDILGVELDSIGLVDQPVEAALAARTLIDAELTRGGSTVVFRIVPLLTGGRQNGALVLSKDVSELREKERLISVKDTTIREIHHRVKNNLQTIASLLRLQGRRLRSDEAKAALHESVLRIGSIALVHETLSESPSEVAEFGVIVRRVIGMVRDGLMATDAEISIEVDGDAGALGADVATPLAVSVTELIQNAVEHAFTGRTQGHVRVQLGREGETVIVSVSDDGVGIDESDLEASRLGLQIVRSLIEEMGGSFAIHGDNGTTAELRVPAVARRR